MGLSAVQMHLGDMPPSLRILPHQVRARPLSCLPYILGNVPPSLGSVFDYTSDWLQSCMPCSFETCCTAYVFVLPYSGARSATELYAVQRSAKKIVTFCADLDRILGGGVCTGQVTEFCEWMARRTKPNN